MKKNIFLYHLEPSRYLILFKDKQTFCVDIMPPYAEQDYSAFNAVNHVNYNNPNTSFSPNRQGVNSNASFGRITSALEPRRMQFGARLEF